MSALVSALDNFTDAYKNTQIGENGHVEYGMSSSVQEKILQFSFQLTRTNEDGIKNLEKILRHLLKTLKNILEKSESQTEKKMALGYLSILYRMIGHTRDIIDGKGECTLTYMMIYTWGQFYPELAKFALRCLVYMDDTNAHQYGSWKDIKYFCSYYKNELCETYYEKSEHPLIDCAVSLINEQLKMDQSNLHICPQALTLVSKWIPREKSNKFGWMYETLATNYFAHYINTANNEEQRKRAIIKCKMDYRKLIAKLNKKLDTLQIKQCIHDWASIDFDKVTSISLSKQKKAFLNIKKNGEVRCPESFDRIECAENFNYHINKIVKGETEMKGKRVGMAEFTNQAIQLLHSENNSRAEIDLLNSQWRDNSSQTNNLGKMIAMVDVSGSMEGDPMNAAIALGIRIAEKSILGKRVMTFSSNPTWVNLEGYDDFVSQVSLIKSSDWGMNTNFYAALDLILNSIITNKMEPEDVQDMVLVVLSDMQMDAGDSCNKQTLYDAMKTKYETAGIRVHGRPYKPPHILFWNLRSTSGFPSLSNQSNVSMMSGFSPAILNLFCEQGMESLEACTPWSLLERSLNNDRYKIMGDKLEKEIEA
jgi:hypothetical protein